jgi:hypothetical protein
MDDRGSGASVAVKVRLNRVQGDGRQGVGAPQIPDIRPNRSSYPTR